MLKHQEPQEEQKLLEARTKLVAQLSSKKEAERVEAEHQLEALGPEAVESLLAIVRREAQKRRSTQRGYTWGILGALGILLLISIALSLVHGKPDFSALSQVGSMVAIFGAATAFSQTHKNAATKLAEFDDIRAVGPLADALNMGDKNVNAVVEPALIRLLPRLQATDARLLSPEQRQPLYRALRGKNRGLKLAILKALAQVGEEAALSHVQALTSHEDSEIQAAAQACLQYLEVNIERARAANTLLRAASANDVTPSDVLLRPAQAGVSNDSPEQLLRASSETAL